MAVLEKDGTDTKALYRRSLAREQQEKVSRCELIEQDKEQDENGQLIISRLAVRYSTARKVFVLRPMTGISRCEYTNVLVTVRRLLIDCRIFSID